MDASANPFSNRPIDELPDYREVELRAVAPAYLPYSLTTTGGFWLFLLLLALIVPRIPFLPFELGAFGAWFPVGIALLGAWLTLMAWLDVRYRGWALREHDLIYRSGVIWRKTVILPFARIQHVETASGPVERQFGLMRLKCFTAGGAMTDLSVEGLDEESAGQVRQYLLEQIRDDQSEPYVEPEHSDLQND
jgi:uncharacterized protein